MTLPNESEPWPVGLADIADHADVKNDLMDGDRHPGFAGDQDISTHMLSHTEVANCSGLTRIERGRALHQAPLAQSIPHEYAEVAGMSHNDLITHDHPMEHVWRFLSTARHGANRLDAYLPEVQISAKLLHAWR